MSCSTEFRARRACCTAARNTPERPGLFPAVAEPLGLRGAAGRVERVGIGAIEGICGDHNTLLVQVLTTSPGLDLQLLDTRNTFTSNVFTRLDANVMNLLQVVNTSNVFAYLARCGGLAPWPRLGVPPICTVTSNVTTATVGKAERADFLQIVPLLSSGRKQAVMADTTNHCCRLISLRWRIQSPEWLQGSCAELKPS